MKVVVLDDDENIAFLLDMFLRRSGYWVSAWHDPFVAMDSPRTWEGADLAIVDYDLHSDEVTGSSILRWAREEAGFTGKSILVTGSPGEWSKRNAGEVQEYVDAVLGKVFDVEDLVQTIERLVGG